MTKKYDLHVHTKYSKCSTNDPTKVLRVAKKKGLNGVAITDHNEIKGALKVAELNEDPDFEVIIGEEVMTDQCEILVYYVKERIKPGKYEDVIREVRRQGAVCSIAHPFSGGGRKSVDTEFFENLPRDLLPDAVETFNARIVFNKANRKAREFARKLDLAKTGGSDGHFFVEIGNGYTKFKKKLPFAIKERITKPFGENKFAFAFRLSTSFVLFFRKIFVTILA